MHKQHSLWALALYKIISLYLDYNRRIRPTTGYEGPEGEYRYRSTLFLTSAIGRGW